MASFAQSRVGGGDKKSISACILTGVVRVLDFALLIAAAWLAAIGVGAWLETPLRGLLALAATIGAGQLLTSSFRAELELGRSWRG